MVAAVILAGGLGTRISEESHLRPKPMIEIGGKPILWHIMQIYAAHGVREFIICLGYKGEQIKEYFADNDTPFSVMLADTGEATMTGGRLRRIAHLVGDDDFCMTYGDGVGDISITGLMDFHAASGGLASVTAVQPPGRFGALNLDGDRVLGFTEKPKGDGGWINGGFFMLSQRSLDYISGDAIAWEQEPVEKLACAGKLFAYRHEGFWHPMDTLRDKHRLEELWATGNAPWKIW